MMSVRYRRLLLVAALAAVVGTAGPARADDQPWPSEVDNQLAEVDAKVLKKQRELFAARQAGDSEAVERLSKEFKTLREEHVKLLRATNQMP